MNKVMLGNRWAGMDEPCYVIAEAGINHNSDVEIAKQMVDVARDCGADAVKFQTFKANEFVSDRRQTYTYESQGKTITESMLKMFERYELTGEQFLEISQYCRDREITFFSTPQNIGDLELLLELGVAVIKIGSDDLTNIPLIENYASRGLPLIMSAGMAYLSEIAEAVECVRRVNQKLVVLHCVSSYPAQFEEVNLSKIRVLMHAFPEVVMGFSDHTQGITAALGAVVLGAKVIEKHFTLDVNMTGPDHRFSADPEELSTMVREIRNLEEALGTSEVVPTTKEMEMRRLCRRSLVANTDINGGETIKPQHITSKRPGTGLPPKHAELILGRKTKKTIKKDSLIKLEDLE